MHLAKQLQSVAENRYKGHGKHLLCNSSDNIYPVHSVEAKCSRI